jgi:2-polyprenyl-3-methyl-5-hydroxy-6-metoxy-1,4-benzoquinol methylase
MRADEIDAAAQRSLAAYAEESRTTRLHTRGRWGSCPFRLVEAEVPRSGRILDIGCGHGIFTLYLALRSGARKVEGIDVDAEKIAIARRAADRCESVAVSFSSDDVAGLTPESCDAVTLVDVLYLLGPPARRTLLDRASSLLAPGGVLVVKEIDRRPRWKYAITKLQELAATRIVRITAGTVVDFPPPSEYVTQLTAAGLEVSARRIDRGYKTPHFLITAHRPAS